MSRVKKNTKVIQAKNQNISVLSQQIQPIISTQPQQNISQKQENVLFFIENNEIKPSQVNSVRQQILKAQDKDLLYIVLNTVGGDVHSTVKIIKLFQSNFKKIVVLVPEYAYSSGTVMCLGCDEIYMATEATLGPLDYPMEHPIDGCTISSLDITNTITNLASICSSIGMNTFDELRNNKNVDLRLSKKQAAELAFKTASNIISPIVEKIDPFNLQKGFREAKIGLYYAIDMLMSKTMKGNFKQALKTSQSLVNDYPSHGYGIFRDEAKNTLKLSVFNLEDSTVWDKIRPVYEKTILSYNSFIEFKLI